MRQSSIFILRSNQVKQNCLREIKAVPVGGEPWRVVEIKPPTKTRQQEEYFHALLGLYCNHTGDNKVDIKREIKFQYLPTVECKGRVATYDKFGEINGFEEVTILEPISSKKISTKQYNLLIEDITVKCMTKGVKVPDPSYFGYDFGR